MSTYSKPSREPRPLAERLRFYGVDLSPSDLDDLALPQEPKVGRRTMRTIDITDATPGDARVRNIRCDDIDTVKRLIGVSDETARARRARRGRVFQRRSQISYSLREVERAVADESVSTEMAAFLFRAAEQYIFDDSHLFLKYKEPIQAFFMPDGAFDLKFAGLGTVNIPDGWTLTIGKDFNIFFADKILIETGGRIRRLFAPLKLDVGEFRQIEPQLPISDPT